MKVLLRYILLVSVQFGFGQPNNDNKVLHFLSASPDMRLDYSTYLTVFYKYQMDSLIAVDTLNNEKDIVVKRVMIYPFLGKMFIQDYDYKKSEINNGYYYDFSLNKLESGSLPFKRVFSYPNALVMDGKLSVILSIQIGSQLGYRALSTDFDVVEVSQLDYQQFMTNGAVGAPIKNSDQFLLVFDTTLSLLRMPITRNVENRPIFNYQMKDYFVEPKGRYISALVKNDKWVVLDIDPKGKENQTTYHIQSINKDNEHTLEVEGNQTRTRSFKDWLAGSIVEFNPSGTKFSPGREHRKNEPDAYGPPYDVMTKVLELYYPGRLFLYHMPSRKYFEWETLESGEPQGDSEILLVEEETIYYRINDKIYQAEIIDGEKLGEPKLLVQDDRVPDIHWAFFSSE